MTIKKKKAKARHARTKISLEKEKSGIPATLVKQGIRGVKDNIGPGQKLYVPGSSIMTFFGKEITERFTTRGGKKSSKRKRRPK